METLSNQMQAISNKAIEIVRDLIKANNGHYALCDINNAYNKEEQELMPLFISASVELYVDTEYTDNDAVYLTMLTGDNHASTLHYIDENGIEGNQQILELNDHTVCEIADWIIKNNLI